MEKFFQQSSWLGIEFRSLPVTLDPLNLAGAEFYDAFYERVFQTYPTYSDFPSDWRDQKRNDAAFISRFISKNSNLLSFGCGVGYLESCLMEFLGKNFYVADFSPYILKYRPDLTQNFLSVEETEKQKFSHILLNQVTYAFNETELYELMYKLSGCLEEEGTLIISFSELEVNFRVILSRFVTFFSTKCFSKLGCGRKLVPKQSQSAAIQGWGYHRSKKEMFSISIAMNFEILYFSRFGSQSYIFLRKNTKSNY